MAARAPSTLDRAASHTRTLARRHDLDDGRLPRMRGERCNVDAARRAGYWASAAISAALSTRL